MTTSALLPDTLRLVLDRVVEGVVLYDADGRPIWCNPSARRILGASAVTEPGAAEGAEAWPAIREDGSQLPWSEHPAMTALRSGLPRRDVIMGVAQPDGSHRWVSVNAQPIRRTGESRPSSVVASFVDMTAIRDGVTRLHALEAQLRQSQKMEAIGQLTGGIAHDFNNLLTAILTNADLLADALPASKPEAHAELDDLRRAAHRGAELIRKLTTFSRRDRVELVLVDPAGLMWEATRLLRRVVPEHIELQTQIAKDLPAIQADPASLEQVLVNLATNARDAMPKGGVLRIEALALTMDAAECRSVGWGRPGPYVRLVVSDNGLGMDAETLERIFEPFFTTKPVGEGTGLGMSIVYGLLQQHGAYLKVDSEPGKGTRVEMRFLPADAPAPAAPGGEDAAREPPGGTETILLVEDNEGVRAATQRILERGGYHVVTATNGEDALQLYQVHHREIALVLADIVMPRMGGIELAASLRRQGSNVRIVLTSGYTERAAEAVALGAPILQKPWTPGQLARFLRQALDGTP